MKRRLLCLLWAGLLLLSGCGKLNETKDKLLDKGFELFFGDEAQQQMLHALADGNYAALREAVEAGADVNCRDAWSGGRFETALICAAHSGSWRIVDCLLQHGAEVNAPDHDGATPLDHAATPAIVRLLEGSGGVSGSPEAETT